MATPLPVEIVAVDGEVWSGEAEMVIARTTDGELGVLAHHAPLLGVLVEGGMVRIQQLDGDEIRVAVDGGFISVSAGGVQILAESAELGAAGGEA